MTQQWLRPVLDGSFHLPARDKQFNDPIWGTITLYPWEVVLLDTPMVQRLRGVKQLGMAYLVFPSATHDRFSHLCGAVEAAARMLECLEQNRIARTREQAVEGHRSLQDHERYQIRLAALIHDIGHGPFSHTIEPVVGDIYRLELDAIADAVRDEFQSVSSLSVSEAIAIMAISSDAFQRILQLPFMAKVANGADGQAVAYNLASAVVGGSSGTLGGCLSSIVSSQIDADKLDYMARDAYHAGLPVDFDSDRLIRKLEFLTVESTRLLPRLSGLRTRIFQHDPPRYYEIGLGQGGAGAFEQMLIGRVFLYDRLYHHHKVRCADGMARRLIHYASAQGQSLNLRALYASIPDDSIVRAFAGTLGKLTDGAGQEIDFPATDKSRELATSILTRSLYKRAFAFAGRFVAGLDSSVDPIDQSATMASEDERDAERSRTMDRINTDLADFQDQLKFEREIADLGANLGKSFDGQHDLHRQAIGLDAHHVVLDLPKSPYPARITVIVRTDDGHLDVPDLFYDPARWAEVYNIQRRTGFVFAEPSRRELIGLASRLWFLRQFSAVFDTAADRYAKTQGMIKDEWLSHLVAASLISEREASYIRKPRLLFVPVAFSDSHLPKQWREEEPAMARRLSEEFNAILRDGIPAGVESELRTALRGITQYLHTRSQDSFVTQTINSEAELQQDLLRSLRDQRLDVDEAKKIGGGITDLIVGRRVIVENKWLRDPTDNPFKAVPHAGVQARRYTLPTGQKFVFTVLAYRSASENGKLAARESIQVRQLEGVDDPFVEIRVAVRYGDSLPSKVK